MRRVMVLALLIPVASYSQLKYPPNKVEEAKQYHTPNVSATPARLRMQAYNARLKAESESFFGNISWRSVGPEIQGGRVIWIDRPKKNVNDFYAAFATGGLWRSRDMGNRWEPLFDRESSFAIGHFALSGDGKTIWVGTGENNSQRTSYSGTGVFKSTDSGATWTHMGLEETHRIGKVLIDPKNEDTVWVGAIGALYSPNPARGVYKTTNGGKTWQHVLKLNDLTGVIDMVMDPRKPDTVYAAAWERDRRAWNFREGGQGTAIYKTVDGGKTWQKLTMGLPKVGDMGRIGLAIAPSRPDTVYALIDNQSADENWIYKDEFVASGVLTARRFAMITKEDVFAKIDRPILERFVRDYLPSSSKLDDVLKGIEEKKTSLADIRKLMEERNPNLYLTEIVDSEVYRTDDGGKTWKKTHPGYLGEHLGYYAGRIFVHPQNHEEVNFTGLFMYRSVDGGKNWRPLSTSPHVDYHAYWYDEHNPNFQACGNDGGLYFSFDSGAQWRHINSMPVGQFTTIAVDDKTPYNIYGGLQDNGTLKGPANYVPGRSNLWNWTTIGGGDGSALAVDPRNGGDVVYGASQWGSHFGLNQLTNQRWNARPSGSGLRFQWISPFIVSPHHPDIVYCGSQRLHRSLNQGRTWEVLSGDLTTNRPNGDVPYATLKDISESPFKFGYLVIGTDDGKVWLTKDHGANWKEITPPSKDKWVCRVIASKHDAKTIYVAQTGYREDDWTPYLWKSTDEGATWTSIVGNLPMETLNVIREDPTKPNWLYIGTDLGVWFTMDGGKIWYPLDGGIPRTPAHDLAVQARENELVVGTHARSVFVFRLNDLTKVVNQIGKDLYVYPIDTMPRANWEYRRRAEWDTSDGLPPTLRVEFFTATAGEAVVRIKSKDGNVLVESKGAAKRGYNTQSLTLMLEGSKRYTIDAKGRKIETPADAVADPFAAERAKYVPAGEYTIEVTVGGKTQTTTWKLT